MSTHVSADSLIFSIANYPLTDQITNLSASILELDELFKRLQNTPQGCFTDPSRSVFIKEIAQFARSIYSHVLVLTQYFNHEDDNNYELIFNSATEAQQALTKILRLSFNEEYRNAEVSLGLVNAICQLLVLDVAVFGLKKDKMTYETRRLIGNTLTNFTFGNIKVKLKICSHDGFLATATKLIDNHDELLQAYAALIRNLSWNSDNRMSQALTKTVPALSRAATIRLQELHPDIFSRKDTHDDNKSLLAVLSALWNLASHSIENKRAICETQAFLFLLIINLTNDPDKILFVENGTGILKYIAGYIAEKEHLLKIVHDAKIVKHLLSLLSSSSFTVILNTLGVLGILVRDQRTQLKLVQSDHARLILDNLSNSSRDDIRNAVKILLTYLNGSPLSGFAMTLPSTSKINARKEMRTSYDSNAIPHLISNQQLLPHRQVSQSIVSPDVQSSFKSSNNSYSTFPYSRRPRTESKEKPDAFVFEGNLTESQIGTCNGSIQSLEVPSNWRSNITTNKNSGNHSPTSPSDLPDSPSNFFLDDDQLDEESCILAEAIEAAMPKPRQAKNTSIKLLTRSDSDDGTEILTNAINSVMPKPRRRDHLSLTPSVAPLNSNRHINYLEQSALMINENTTENVRDASKLETTGSNDSEDNFLLVDNVVVDGMIPADIDAEFQAEQLVIDCLSVEKNRQPSKTNRSARISPFNYKKPSALNEKPDKSVKTITLVDL